MPYDKDFAKISEWLRENGLIAVTDINGRTVIKRKPK